MYFTYICSNIEVSKHMKSVLIKLSESNFSPGVELVHTRLTVFLPPGLRRAPWSRLITSDWLVCVCVCVCVCATVVASVCWPGFLWGQSVTFELPGAVTSWVMTCSGRTLHTHRSSARQPDRQREINTEVHRAEEVHSLRPLTGASGHQEPHDPIGCIYRLNVNF